MASKNIVDVDDLLDEIEGSLQKSSLNNSSRVPSRNATASNFRSAESKQSDASDLLKSLDEIDTNDKKTKTPKQSSILSVAEKPSSAPIEAPTLKCRTIFLAGPKELEYGHCSMIQEKACDNLHCMKCDFQVLLFKGQHWVSTVNYMFFRNFVPDRQHLSKKLSKAPDHTAYCCQCSWISVSTRKQLGQTEAFQWCCNAH